MAIQRRREAKVTAKLTYAYATTDSLRDMEDVSALTMQLSQNNTLAHRSGH